MSAGSSRFDPATGLAIGTFGIGTYADGDRSFPALVLPDGAVHDLSSRWHDTHAILDDWDRALDKLVDLAAQPPGTPLRVDALVARPPLAHPNLLCAGANYRVHVAEMMTHNAFNQHSRLAGEDDAAFFARNLAEVDRRAREGMPFFWTGLHSSLAGANDDVALPLIGDSHDWELEFGAVLRAGARYVTPDEADDLVAGYVMCNDLGTVSEFRRTDVRWGYDWVSKHQPGFKPTGPFIVPRHFVDVDAVRITLSVNGVIKQDWPASDMIFSVAQLLSYASERIRLMPGDILITGSPPGNGASHGHYLAPGDVMDSAITFLGRQRNHVIAEAVPPGRQPTYGKFPTA